MTSDEVKQIRNDLKMSQEDFARALNVSYTTVNRWENGKAQPTGPVVQLLRAFQRASNKPDILEIIAQAALIGGTAYLLYKLLEAAFED